MDDQRSLIQWDIDSNSIVKRIGSQQNLGRWPIPHCFLLWAVLYGKLFTKRIIIITPSKNSVAIIFGLVGILFLALGCDKAYSSRRPSQIAFTLLLLVAGSGFVINSIRLFFAKQAKGMASQH